MNLVLASISVHTGKRLAEVGFLLVLIAGAWLVAAGIPGLRLRAARSTVAGGLLTAAGLLLIVATRWGHFG
jgi:hypothetical protein